MAKIRERTVKADTLVCFNCGDKYSPYERKDVLRADRLPEEFIVTDKDALWDAAQPYILKDQVFCPGCEEIRYDDFDLFEEGQTIWECTACDCWWDDASEASRCC